MLWTFGGSGLLGGAIAGCVILCRATICGVTGSYVMRGCIALCRAFLASEEGSSTLYSGTVYSGSFSGYFGVRSDIVVPFFSSRPAPHAVAWGGVAKSLPVGRGFPPLAEAVAFLGVHGSILIAALFASGVLPCIHAAGRLVLLRGRFFSPSVSFHFLPTRLLFFQVSRRPGPHRTCKTRNQNL